MTPARRWLLVALIAIVLGGTGLGVYAMTLPPSSPVTPVATAQPSPSVRAMREPRTRARPERSKAKAKAGKGKAKAKVASKAARAEGRQAKLPPGERAKAREEYREERLDRVNDRLEAYAAKSGWDAETTDMIRSMLLDNADYVTGVMAEVDRGDVSWEEVRKDMRSYRLEQADMARELLGEEEFTVFVREMDFARFFGEQPVRGRITRR